MKLLLDTHALFWWFTDDKQLTAVGFGAIGAKANEIHVSVATLWEMAIKVGNGRWPEASGLLNDAEGLIAAEGFRLLPISLAHIRAAGLMSSPHRDPFDRLLAAQAEIEGLTLITADPKVQALGASWIW